MDVIKKIVNFNRTKKNRISNYIFRMNRAFAYICVVFSFLVSSKQFFGNPIYCFGHNDNMKLLGDSINNYCWILGTFTYKNAFEGKIGHNFANYGLGNAIRESDRSYQKYYQWVVFVFIGQAFMFYMPYYWWTICDGGRIHMLCKDLSFPIVTPKWTKDRKKLLMGYLEGDNKLEHRKYALQYFFFEFLYFIISVINIVFINFIFSGFWYEYYPAMKALITFDFDNWYSNNSRVFPKLAKCEFSDYGPSGSIQMKDFMCVLSVNILNEKLFAFLWLYLVILGVVQAINLIFRIVTLASTYMRQQMILALVKPLDKKKLRRAMGRCKSIAEWFMLFQLGSNLNPTIFREVLRELDLSDLEPGTNEDDEDDKLVREKIV